MRWHCPLYTCWIRNSSSDCLSPSTLPLGHRGSPQCWNVTSEREKNISFLWNLNARAEDEPSISDFQAGSFNHCTSVPALEHYKAWSTLKLNQIWEAMDKSCWYWTSINWELCKRLNTLGQDEKNNVWSNAQTRDAEPMIAQCWPSVCDADSTLSNHWLSGAGNSWPTRRYWHTYHQ